MKIRIMSDLHLEFQDPPCELELPNPDSNTVLILAGDIGLAKKTYTYANFLKWCSENFLHVIYVLGNHEHYKGSIDTSHAKIWTECLPFENVHVIEDELVEIDDVVFIGATLWTNFNNWNAFCMEKARCWMNDFKIIRTGPKGQPWQRKLQPKDLAHVHMHSKNFIFDNIKAHKAEGKKIVVVTHHLPSELSIAPQFKHDELNGAYASEYWYDIEDTKPDVWIHGHTHASFDYHIGDTRVICNPRGYYPNDLNPDFNIDLTVKV